MRQGWALGSCRWENWGRRGGCGGKQGGWGGLTVPGLGLRGALVTPGWEVVAEFKAGEGRDLVCDLVVPHSGGGSWAASPSPREVLSISRRHLLSCRQVSVFGSVVLQGSLGSSGAGVTPKNVPRGTAFLLGSWGLCPSLRNPWAPTSPHPHPIPWNVWEISSVVHGAGWGHLPGSCTL